MRIKVDRRSDAYRRVMSAGFRITNIQLIKQENQWCCPMYKAICRFTCICGTKEYFSQYFPEGSVPKKLDIAKQLERRGAISEKHLIGDGYSKSEINYILREYRKYD